MNFQVTVLKILVSYPDGFALMADLKRDMAILATSGRDWAERTKRLAARASHLDIFSQALVERENGGWRITAKGRPPWNSWRRALPQPIRPSCRPRPRRSMRLCPRYRTPPSGRGGVASAASAASKPVNEPRRRLRETPIEEVAGLFRIGLESVTPADLEWHRRGNQMPVSYPVRKACPACGRPMKAVSDEAREGHRGTSAPTATTTRCTTRPPGSGRTAHCGRRRSERTLPRRSAPASSVCAARSPRSQRSGLRCASTAHGAGMPA
ncbi:hypothetical protein ABIC07_004179 [Bradyrhizobium sp. RT9a]